MPILTTTIEDTSPLLVFSANSTGKPAWQAGTSDGDPYSDQYSEGTYMVTKVNQANVSFAFYGNGVQIFGAKRPNYGTYYAVIDSKVYPPVSANDTSPGAYQTSLFTTVALGLGCHTVTMVNNEKAYLDIDFLTYQTPIGLDNEALLVSTTQDSESSFAYSPSSEWDTNPVNIGTFSGGSGHVTSTTGAFVEFAFKGWFYNRYLLPLDKATPENYTAFYPVYRPQNSLFLAHNLGSGEHIVRITSQAAVDSALTLAIDYAQVYTTPSLGGIQSASIPTPSAISDISGQSHLVTSSRMPRGVIAGISVLATLLLLLLGFVGLYFWQKRKARQASLYIKLATSSAQNSQYNTPEPSPPIRRDGSFKAAQYNPDGKYRPDLGIATNRPPTYVDEQPMRTSPTAEDSRPQRLAPLVPVRRPPSQYAPYNM